MTFRWVVVAVLLLVACGCAARWEHSEKQSSAYYADDRECQAMTGGAARGIEVNEVRVSYESCMWEKGWRKKQTVWFFDPPQN